MIVHHKTGDDLALELAMLALSGKTLASAEVVALLAKHRVIVTDAAGVVTSDYSAEKIGEGKKVVVDAMGALSIQVKK